MWKGGFIGDILPAVIAVYIILFAHMALSIILGPVLAVRYAAAHKDDAWDFFISAAVLAILWPLFTRSSLINTPDGAAA